MRANAPAASASTQGRAQEPIDTAATADKAGVADSAGAPARAASSLPETRNEVDRAADAGFVDDPEEDIPPATASSPAVRDAWLRRISQLLEQGNRQEAKASLAEFKRRYPNVLLPPPLRALDIEP